VSQSEASGLWVPGNAGRSQMKLELSNFSMPNTQIIVVLKIAQIHGFT